MGRHVAALAGAIAVALAGPAMAQAAWFGVPTPGPVTPVEAMTFKSSPTAYGPAPARGRPKDDVRGALTGAKMMADVRTIVDFGLARRAAGDPLWGRISGLPGAKATVEWSVAKLKASGLGDARMEEYAFDAPQWLPQSWNVHLVGDPAFGAGTKDVVMQSAVPDRGSGSTTSPVTGQLIFVGRGSAAEIANVDVRGKVAVVNVLPLDSLFAAREKGVARDLAKRGAVGVINAVESPGNMLYYDGRYSCSDAPCFLVGGDDGAFLESIIGKAAAAGKTVSVTLSVKGGPRSGLVAHNGYATIPGKSPEVVIVNAHADSWWTGADDNADGLAVMLGLADYYAHRKEKPDRTLVFMVSGGHHTANGPAAFIKAHPEIIARTVLVMNLEHLAQIQVPQEPRLDPATSGYTSGVWSATTTESSKGAGAANSTPYVWDLLGKASKDYGVVTSYEPSPSAPGDLGAYIRAGLPSAQLISSEVYYHSSGDAPSTISVPGLEKAAAFFAGFIADVAKAPKEKLKGPLTPQRPPPPATSIAS